MSRCFPYPPPGYYPKGERKEALIESSIKLQKEKEKAKAESKKERHREKKEKRRESKVKDTSEFGHGEKRKRKHKDEKSHKGETSHATDVETKYIQKRTEDEAEQLERSNLTEEHGQPVSLQNPCYSSDSTENSNKRRRQASPVHGIRCTQGNVLRIRLPSLKLKEPEINEEIYSSSKSIQERIRLPSLKLKEPEVNEEIYSSSKPVQPEFRSLKLKEPEVNEEKLYSSSKLIQEEFPSAETDVCKRDEEQICSTSGGTGISAQDKLCKATASKSKSDTKASTSKSGIPTVESLFKDLVENWVSPPIQSERTDLDELEWLFGPKHPGRERAKVSSDILCTGSADLLPRARYLPEADIYALPFTVPF